MFGHGTAHTVRRRFLHAPSSCRIGCRVCLGSLLSGRAGAPGRRSAVGASAALLTVGTLLVFPPDGDPARWRGHAAVLAAELSRIDPAYGSTAGTLSTELELLGHTPVQELSAGSRATPPDDEDGATTGPDDPEPGPGPDLASDPDSDSDEDRLEASAGQDDPADRDPDLRGPGRRDPDLRAAGGSGWEDTAQELADLLAEFGGGDGAARALADALAEAGFDPSTRDDRASRDGEDTSDSNGEGSERGAAGGGGEVLWEADVETGDLSQFEGGGDDPQQVGAPEPEIVDGRDGDHAVSFTIPGGGNRNEVLPAAEFSDGDEYWFGFSSLLEDGFPVDASWQVITQWKNDGTGSPPLSLNVENGEYLLHGGYGVGKEWTESIGPATTGEWVDWVIYVEFDSGGGLVEVWRDGEQVVEGLVPSGGTLYPGKGSYLKIGYYRDTAIGEDGTVVFDNWRMGTSYDAVAPAGASAGSATAAEDPTAGLPDRRGDREDQDGAGRAGTEEQRPRSSVPFTAGG